MDINHDLTKQIINYRNWQDNKLCVDESSNIEKSYLDISNKHRYVKYGNLPFYTQSMYADSAKFLNNSTKQQMLGNPVRAITPNTHHYFVPEPESPQMSLYLNNGTSGCQTCVCAKRPTVLLKPYSQSSCGFSPTEPSCTKNDYSRNCLFPNCKCKEHGKNSHELSNLKWKDIRYGLIGSQPSIPYIYNQQSLCSPSFDSHSYAPAANLPSYPTNCLIKCASCSPKCQPVIKCTQNEYYLDDDENIKINVTLTVKNDDQTFIDQPCYCNQQDQNGSSYHYQPYRSKQSSPTSTSYLYLSDYNKQPTLPSNTYFNPPYSNTPPDLNRTVSHIFPPISDEYSRNIFSKKQRHNKQRETQFTMNPTPSDRYLFGKKVRCGAPNPSRLSTCLCESIGCFFQAYKPVKVEKKENKKVPKRRKSTPSVFEASEDPPKDSPIPKRRKSTPPVVEAPKDPPKPKSKPKKSSKEGLEEGLRKGDPRTDEG
ncbi:hypothetical protein HELRODRAFT_172596 [Helobdella robusta]|uniref:Uncharacterized protein n=1 Tax=Helobdella robusta TaxID=6412 RepID=T1F5L0_HELRO|nr:hypothetical protein HELRODRAFT_172596 [Helobdella robusta]ESO04240.1 hypothetical protein HELRODRAFT_172596 [Helobdella robusta]